MIDRYRVSAEVILDDLGNVIFSPASGDGRSRCDSPDGPTTATCGPEAVPASLSVPPASAVGPLTSVTCGPSLQGSSASAALQQCLASRLRARMGVNGSPEYSLTWKAWTMPLREPICALRASGRRTSASGFTGRPTTTARHMRQYSDQALHTFIETGQVSGHSLDLNAAAQLAGWPTPNTPSGGRSVSIEKMDATGRTTDGRKHTASLEHAAKFALCGWATPTTRDHKDGAAPSVVSSMRTDKLSHEVFLAGWSTPTAPRKNDSDLSAFRWNPNKKQDDPVMQCLGRTQSLSDVPTAKRGALNPLFSLWLMLGSGELARAWASCAGPATRSSRKSRRNSSPP